MKASSLYQSESEERGALGEVITMCRGVFGKVVWENPRNPNRLTILLMVSDVEGAMSISSEARHMKPTTVRGGKI